MAKAQKRLQLIQDKIADEGFPDKALIEEVEAHYVLDIELSLRKCYFGINVV